MSWKQLLESVSESLNDHIRLRHDYLMAENRILHNQIDGRVQMTDSECKELAELDAKLGKKVLEEIATVAQPDTILAWYRQFADQPVDTSASPGPSVVPAWIKRLTTWWCAWRERTVRGVTIVFRGLESPGLYHH